MILSIFTTTTSPIQRQDPYHEAISCYSDLADEVIVINGNRAELPHYPKMTQIYSNWPIEFEWQLIGRQFQKGYEACSGEWVIHADLDFFFHENDFEEIRNVLSHYNDQPALSFWKYQFLKADRYNLKSRMVIAVNKGKFGNRIRFDSGGDLCQPSLNGEYINPLKVPEARIPFYNYDFLLKTKEVVKKDFARFARSWAEYKGYYGWGGPDNESALEFFCQMQEGRFRSREHKVLKLEEHPKYVQHLIKNLKSNQFGFNGWGMFNV